MSHHEQERYARERRKAETLAEIADEIGRSKDLVDAAFMAALDLPESQRDPLRALLDLISDKLAATSINLTAHVEGSTDAA